MDSNPILSKKILSIVVAASTLLAVYAVLASTGSTPFLGVQQATAQQQSATTTGHTNSPTASDSSANHNKPEKINLDGITLSFAVPEQVHATELTNINLKITHTESGAPISHVDWVISIKDPSGNEVYKTQTTHSHVGVESFSYAFMEPGKNTVHIQAASLGPKMMGMDVPKEAQTRIFASGDPMKSPEVDKTFFFGTRSHDFVVNVGGPGGVQTVTSDMGKKIELSLSTNPEKIVVGQPTTLILDVKNAETGMNIMHPDALITIRQGGIILTQSAAAGNPMMPMSGAYHGHTGMIALTTVFPTTGLYYIQVDTNSLPVSDVQYGHANARFRILVTGSEGSTNDKSTSTSEISVPNQISILGQGAPYFGPSNLTVKAGQAVTFKNVDSVLHAIATTSAAPGETPTPDGIVDTGLLNHGESKQVTFDKAGTYNYFCTIHPQMRGTVTVTG
jgi:plastocyanin